MVVVYTVGGRRSVLGKRWASGDDVLGTTRRRARVSRVVGGGKGGGGRAGIKNS